MAQQTTAATVPSDPTHLDVFLDDEASEGFFKALCDPNRLTLLVRLARADVPMTVTEASECCGVHVSGASRHLKTLLDAGIVRSERVGREVRYRLDCASLVGRLRGLADAFEACYESCCGASCSTDTHTPD